jgi:hypothetical protein
MQRNKEFGLFTKPSTLFKIEIKKAGLNTPPFLCLCCEKGDKIFSLVPTEDAGTRKPNSKPKRMGFVLLKGFRDKAVAGLPRFPDNAEKGRIPFAILYFFRVSFK